METELDEMKEVAREVRMETVLDLLSLDPPDSSHKIRSIHNPDENVPSLHIYEYDFYDFSTGQGGDQIEFVKLVLKYRSVVYGYATRNVPGNPCA